jgi:hypothetical protein
VQGLHSSRGRIVAAPAGERGVVVGEDEGRVHIRMEVTSKGEGKK